MQKLFLTIVIFCLTLIALAQDPACTELDFDEHIKSGQIAYADQTYPDAVFHFDCATQLNSESAYAYRLLGDTYYDNAQVADAIQSYGRYRTLAGDETEAYVIARLTQSEFGLEEAVMVIGGMTAFFLATCAPVLIIVGIVFWILRKRPTRIVKDMEDGLAMGTALLEDDELLQLAEQFYYEANVLNLKKNVEYPLFNNADGWRAFINTKEFLGLWIALKSMPASMLQENDIDLDQHQHMMNRLQFGMRKAK